MTYEEHDRPEIARLGLSEGRIGEILGNGAVSRWGSRGWRGRGRSVKGHSGHWNKSGCAMCSTWC